ncbi:MAG: MoxR family ATPase [Deltaproteobacteria bacterium]|nr:MAG: MoxR family ATPase [Deltaproteobacteria bacterium]
MQDVNEITRAVEETGAFVDGLMKEAARRIVGQEQMVQRLLIGLLTGGHVLLEGLPGLAKTLTVSTLAELTRAEFSRIQFTPDLLPADIVGTPIYNPKTQGFEPRKGPIFANLVLADEINRAPAKVQSALLEAMQEKQVTIGDQTFPLPKPFLVLATQNPIDQEGTYPLPEAQMDRFMLMVKVGYPTRAEERLILDRMSGETSPPLDPVIDGDTLLSARSVVERIHLDEAIREYIVDLVMASRQPAEAGIERIAPWIACGASPRATIFLARASRAHAFVDGRGYVVPEDVKAIAHDVLRHRVIPSFEAEADEIDGDQLVQAILDGVDVP